MRYDFDKITDRKNTNSLKYDCALERGRPEDLLPLWVADMDFPAPKEVVSALKRTAAHGIYGYTEPNREYFSVLSAHLTRHFEWTPQREWWIQTPGIVFALAEAVKAFTEKGDAVIIQQPVYYPFSEVVVDNGRRLIDNGLKFDGIKYVVDFADFENKITENNVKLFLLCSPHNPVGRVWTEAELLRLAEICLRHNVIIVSDEIHSLFVYDGNKHTCFGALGEKFYDNLVLCTSPGKAFNIAGLQLSDIFIPNPALRDKFRREHNASGYSQLNTFSHSGALAAYKYGDGWLKQLLAYLQGNRDFIKDFLECRIPEITMPLPEGTYLAWLDLSALKLSRPEQKALIVDKAKLWLDNGRMFGDKYSSFERINFACPRSILATALEQLEKALYNN
ncbi:MAG: pyridoxal phosphate-dependent aminotransferase [Clostridiaceae bacterium]|nr:pyridoxal phosphate-dependent aminotransferase [Clostridiaceae bacterium]